MQEETEDNLSMPSAFVMSQALPNVIQVVNCHHEMCCEVGSMGTVTTIRKGGDGTAWNT